MQMFFRWIVLSGRITFVQVAVQGTNAISGLLLVRSLSKDEYAWFTIGASLLATVSLLADGGISTALTTLGGQVHSQLGHFAKLFRSGITISIKLSILACLLAFPIYAWLLHETKASTLTTLGILGLAALGVWPSIQTLLLNVANRLNSRVNVVQVSDALCAASRLALTALFLLGQWKNAIVALLAVIAASWTQAIVVRYKTSGVLEHRLSETYEPQIFPFIRSLYANHIFFCIQGQICTLIVGFLASSGEVADLGALARLSAIFSAITAPAYYLAVPAIAKIHDVSKLRVRFLFVFGAYCSVIATLIVLAWKFPDPLLYLIGDKYRHLSSELTLALCAQGIAVVTSLAWTLALARGWIVRYAWFTILLSLLGYCIGAFLFPLDTVKGVLLFSVISGVPTLLFCVANIIRNLCAISTRVPGEISQN